MKNLSISVFYLVILVSLKKKMLLCFLLIDITKLVLFVSTNLFSYNELLFCYYNTENMQVLY